MIFEKLFLQFQEDKRPCFGSRFMNWHGRWLIGKPRGLMPMEGISDDVEQCFYFLRPDRHPPQDPIALRNWVRGSLYCAQVREGTAPGKLARAQYPIDLLLASALFLAGLAVMGGKVAADSAWKETKSFVRVHVGGVDAIQKAALTDLVFRDCDALNKAVQKKEITVQAIRQETLNTCIGIIRADETKKLEENRRKSEQVRKGQEQSNEGGEL